MMLMGHMRAYIVFSTLILDYLIYSALVFSATELYCIKGTLDMYNRQAEGDHKNSFMPLPHRISILHFRES